MKLLRILYIFLSIPILASVAFPLIPIPPIFCEAKAFPQAMGFGTDTPGGRGGRIIYVTNQDDAGTGSLRDAVETSGPRIVLFRISGTITLKSDIVVREPFITIAGQTAPGEGVQIRGAQVKIATHDVIIRYLKVRSGDASDKSTEANRDAVTIYNDFDAYNVVIDHSTMIWGPDVGGVTFLSGAHKATVSYSIVGEGLYYSNHPEATFAQSGHSKGLAITELASRIYPEQITIHHNLITTSADRNPRIIGGVNIDVVNNVIYNWEFSSSQGNPRSLNLINNYYIRGPMTTDSIAFYAWMPKVELGGILHLSSVFESGNKLEGFNEPREGPMEVYVAQRFNPYSMNFEDSPDVAYRKIVADSGADLQVAGETGQFQIIRDSVDKQIINNLVTRQGAFVNGVNDNGVSGFSSIIWPSLASGTPAIDSDNDGMPDAWEKYYFGNTERGSSYNSSSDFDNDGYTDVEEYLNRTNPTRPQFCLW